MQFSSLGIFAAVSLFGFTTFASPPTANYDQSYAVTKVGAATVWADWVKDKKTKFDVHLNIRNENKDTGIIVMQGEMGCARGAVTGELKYTFFNTGERMIDLKPNQTKSFNLVCKLPTQAKGEYTITVGHVYTNPSLDGKTIGKPVAQDFAIHLPETK